MTASVPARLAGERRSLAERSGTLFVAIHFIFPRDSAEPAQPEQMFADQWVALTSVGFSASLCSDDVLAATKPLRNIPSGSQVVYRGWMLKDHPRSD